MHCLQMIIVPVSTYCWAAECLSCKRCICTTIFSSHLCKKKKKKKIAAAFVCLLVSRELQTVIILLLLQVLLLEYFRDCSASVNADSQLHL